MADVEARHAVATTQTAMQYGDRDWVVVRLGPIETVQHEKIASLSLATGNEKKPLHESSDYFCNSGSGRFRMQQKGRTPGSRCG